MSLPSCSRIADSGNATILRDGNRPASGEEISEDASGSPLALASSITSSMSSSESSASCLYSWDFFGEPDLGQCWRKGFRVGNPFFRPMMRTAIRPCQLTSPLCLDDFSPDPGLGHHLDLGAGVDRLRPPLCTMAPNTGVAIATRRAALARRATLARAVADVMVTWLVRGTHGAVAGGRRSGVSVVPRTPYSKGSAGGASVQGGSASGVSLEEPSLKHR